MKAGDFTVLLVPGLRDEAPGHWQSLLARSQPNVHALPALGRSNIDLRARIEAIEDAVRSIAGPVVVVAHSGGSIATVHWARQTTSMIQGALLATPPAFSRPLSSEYPDMSAFEEAGWLPLPKAALPFPCIVAASRNDPLGDFSEIAQLARCWGAELVDLGAVGHLNPVSGYGEWPGAIPLIAKLASRGIAQQACQAHDA